MKNIEIDLNQPYERVLATVLSLPGGAAHSDDPVAESELRILLRSIYEAANGRQVETALGLIPVAPPVAEFLKAKPFKVANRADFLIDVSTRVICGPNGSKNGQSN
jgi:hypothetical protein